MCDMTTMSQNISFESSSSLVYTEKKNSCLAPSIVELPALAYTLVRLQNGFLKVKKRYRWMKIEYLSIAIKHGVIWIQQHTTRHLKAVLF